MSHPLQSTLNHPNAKTVLILVRLLLLQNYSQRRSLQAVNTPPAVLQTLTILMVHYHRLETIKDIMGKIIDSAKEQGIFASADYWSNNGRRNTLQEEMGICVQRILRGAKEIGGRATLTVGTR